jgi:hypothetical protein
VHLPLALAELDAVAAADYRVLLIDRIGILVDENEEIIFGLGGVKADEVLGPGAGGWRKPCPS